MKRLTFGLGVMVLLLLFGLSYSQKTPATIKLCCVSGIYEGSHEDIPSASCNEPGKGKFIMHLYQEKGCGTKIWGKIIDPADPSHPQTFTGTVRKGPGGCCIIKGKADSDPTEVIEFKGAMCKVLGKWTIKDGKYRNSRGCTGNFQMSYSKPLPLLPVRRK
jgi:hypothetical protein